MKNQFKLTIELVPSTAWHKSIYQIYREKGMTKTWKKIKDNIFEKEGKRCWICGNEKSRLEAHEFWEYDDKKHIQKLVAIHHLCGMCHKIKHIGLWLHTKDGKEMLKRFGFTETDLINHFCIINNCVKKDFKKYEDEVFKIWKERSSHEWKQDLTNMISTKNSTYSILF